MNSRPSEPPRPICVIGNANLDLVTGSIDDWPEWGTEVFLERSDFRIGGSAANTALVLQRLGHPVGLVSATGSDAASAMITRQFAGALDRIAARPGPTSMSVGILQKGGERSFFSTNGHLDGLDAAFFSAALEDWPLSGAIALVSGGFALPGLMAEHTDFLERLKARGATIAIDPGWPGDGWTEAAIASARAWIGLADHILLNDKEALGLSGEDAVHAACRALAPHMRPDATLVVKRGPEGAACYRRRNYIIEQARPLDVIDTVGAGDAFNAGYLSAVAEGAPERAALRRGIDVASAVISEFPRSGAAIFPEKSLAPCPTSSS
ncbi:carbohydrate kinase family protein [Martelella mediterranea]|uniref:carbohydrate kinase family protein n=1 Tax=Martelella mediterranea TaxID=293089 RepID=UPI001E4AE459|nr:carbohydrate kinase family protein [Martelella mediterranea]MCD1632308.1 carbohydrate kinase family protein [Martelella mediterranea]